MFRQKAAATAPATATAPNTSFSNSAARNLIDKLPFAEHLNKLPAPVRDFVERRPAAAIGIAVLAGLGLLVARRRPRHI